MSSSLGIFAAAFVVTAASVHASIRDPLHLHADVRSEKLVMLQQWHGTMFSAAFGSSHLHDGFDPRAFDAVLSSTPIATRTANLAIKGGSQTEQRVMALQFLHQLESPAQAGARPQPCLVMLEIGAGANFTNDHLVHPRAINIYDWQSVRLVSSLVSPEMPLTQRIGRVGYAVAASALYYSNVGMLSNAIFAPPLDAETLHDETTDDRRGQEPLPDPSDEGAYVRMKETQRPAILPLKPALVTPGETGLVTELADASPVGNVSFVYVEMPRIDDIYRTETYPDHLEVPTRRGAIEVPILNMARPDLYPALYAPELWHDDAHFSGRGAQVFSTVLGQQLYQWYAAHGMPPSCGG